MKRARKNLEIRLSIPRKKARAGLTIALLLSSAYLLGSETLTLNTFYPSPLGIYKKLTTTTDTTLARDGGNVSLVPNSSSTNGKVAVGLGSAAPQATLHIGGQNTAALQVDGTTTFNGAATFSSGIIVQIGNNPPGPIALKYNPTDGRYYVPFAP